MDMRFGMWNVRESLYFTLLYFYFYNELELVFDQFPKYHKKILLYFSAKVGREDISKPAFRNQILHEMVMGLE
jgi:hypothetical protein